MLPFRTLQVLLVILLFGLSTFAQTIKVPDTTDVEVKSLGGTVTVTAPTVLTSNGSNIFVQIGASDTTGQGITGFEAHIMYDPSVITPVGLNAGCSSTDTIFAGNGNPTCLNNSPTPGVISVVMFGTDPVSGAGSILRLNFQVVGAPLSVSPLNFQFFVFNEGDPAHVTVNGTVTVLAPTAAGTSVSGVVMSQSGDAISGVRITLMNQAGEQRTALSNPFGFYRFDEIPVGRIYILSATSKRYTFVPQTISVFDEIANLNLVAEQ